MRRGILLITAMALLLPASSASAQRYPYSVSHFAWSARLTYVEADASGDPETIRDEQGETVSSFRYRVPRGGGATVVVDRSGVFSAGQRYGVARSATWQEDDGSGFAPRDCIDVDRRRGGGGVAFAIRGQRVSVDYDLPVALDTCGPALYDDLELANKLELGSRQSIPLRRFSAGGRLRLGIRGRQVLRPDESGVRAVLTWRVQVKLVPHTQLR